MSVIRRQAPATLCRAGIFRLAGNWVMRNRQPHIPGEEGLQDMKIIEAIYESARSGRSVSSCKA